MLLIFKNYFYISQLKNKKINSFKKLKFIKTLSIQRINAFFYISHHFVTGEFPGNQQMVTSVKPKKILGFDAPIIIINLYICLRQGLKHVKPKLLIQNQPHLFSLSYFRSLPPDLPYHQSLSTIGFDVLFLRSVCLYLEIHHTKPPCFC